MPAYRDKRDGRWRYRKWVRLPSGGRIRVAGTPATDTKVAAESAEREHIERVLHPERVRATQPVVSERKKEVPTLREYAEPFLDGYLPGQKPGVLKHKTQIVHTHLVPFFGDMRLDEIRQSDVDAFARIELRRCARKTVNNRLAVLSTLLKYAHENQVIGKPTLRCHVGGSKAEDAPIVAVSAEDVEKLVAAADAAYKVVVLLAVEAGLRVGELRGAQWTDIGGGEITIRRAIDVDGNVGPPKHNKVRRVPLSPRIVAALATLPKRGLWVLSSDDGSFLVYRTMLKAIQRLYKRAGVVVPRSETGKTMPFHSLRHSFGTECARRGVPVMTLRDLMGHADASTTQRYVTVTSADKHNAIERAFGQQVGNMLPKKAEDPQILVEKL
jgi:integrase